MITLNPRDWGALWQSNGSGTRHVANRSVVQRWMAAIAFALCFASLAPQPLFALTLIGVLVVAGLLSAAVALIQRHSMLSPRFTAWDEAAWSLASGLGLQVLVGSPLS